MSVECVAELGNSHGGHFDLAIRLIDAAKNAGADAVKFQAFTPLELCELRGFGPAPEPWGSQGWTMEQLYLQAMTPPDWFPRLVKHCDAIGMPWFSSVFGPRSLDMLEKLGCPRYKLASLDFDRADWRDTVLSTGKPLVWSCNHKTRPPLPGTALWCAPNYPQDNPQPEMVPRGGYDGFSYHGTDWRVPASATWYGARMIEVHFHLRNEPNQLEASCCLDEWQFAHMVGMVRSHDLR